MLFADSHSVDEALPNGEADELAGGAEVEFLSDAAAVGEVFSENLEVIQAKVKAGELAGVELVRTRVAQQQSEKETRLRAVIPAVRALAPKAPIFLMETEAVP